MVDHRLEICRNAFLSLYSLSDKRVKRLVQWKVKKLSPHDQRGRHSSFNLPVDTKLKIHNHIESFPVSESHYLGNPVNYLKPDLKLMYELFKTKYPNTKVSYSFYLNFFKENWWILVLNVQVST